MSRHSRLSSRHSERADWEEIKATSSTMTERNSESQAGKHTYPDSVICPKSVDRVNGHMQNDQRKVEQGVHD